MFLHCWVQKELKELTPWPESNTVASLLGYWTLCNLLSPFQRNPFFLHPSVPLIHVCFIPFFFHTDFNILSRVPQNPIPSPGLFVSGLMALGPSYLAPVLCRSARALWDYCSGSVSKSCWGALLLLLLVVVGFCLHFVETNHVWWNRNGDTIVNMIHVRIFLVLKVMFRQLNLCDLC